MNLNSNYLKFCKKFHDFRIPGIKFKELDMRIKKIYKSFYQIEEEDINKATLVVLIISFMSSTCFLLGFPSFNIFMILLCTFILSLCISYFFNLRLYKEINKEDMKINSILHLIKIYYSLIEKSLSTDSDRVIAFIQLVRDFDMPISKAFIHSVKNIQEGTNPEIYLHNIKTFSLDFDNYIKELLLRDFIPQTKFEQFEDGSLEDSFKVFVKQLESRLSIVFFIGIFFPLGTCFLILFQTISIVVSLIIIPIYFLILNYMNRKFVKSDIFLIGLISDYSKLEKRKFNEFIDFLKLFSLNLQKNISPEVAYINTFSRQRTRLKILNSDLQNQSLNLVNFTYSFNEMIDKLKIQINSFRYSIILDVLKKILEQNPLASSDKIMDIINVLNRHQKLEKKLEIIIKGEKFKAFLYLFIMPFILGIIGGLIPSFYIILNSINIDSIFQILFDQNVNFLVNIILIFIFLILCVGISSFFFLKIVNQHKINFLIITTCILFTLLFMISFLNISYFI
ncbi:MAG: hypothetical protein KGD73_02945 [Candidatus Lokiarchaeota archaeon]|nr:hypothetical protein [Candidatus Lokiarchaeota archaeon]